MLICCAIYLLVLGLLFLLSLELWNYINIDLLSINIELGINIYNIIILFVVVFVYVIVKVYALEYMVGDAHYNQFLALLSLFIFSMNLLVLSNNWFVFLIAWELLGLVSYFLITYWKDSSIAIRSAIKALVYNKFGDGLILINIVAMYNVFFTFNYDVVLLLLDYIELYYINYLIIVAALTKSALVPFSGWLSDAMTAPTPISALLHAATMVTAGIFLLLRLGIENHILVLIGLYTVIVNGILAIFIFI